MIIYVIYGDDYATFSFNVVDSVHISKKTVEAKCREISESEKYDAIKIIETNYNKVLDFEKILEDNHDVQEIKIT